MKNIFTKDKKMFEDFLKQYLKKELPIEHPQQKILKQAIVYTLSAKASRFRALLSFATASCLGQNKKKILPWALAIEMFHSGSLIHDDLPCMDNDQHRRGKKSNHLVFGEDIALLAGTSLFMESLSLVNRFYPSQKKNNLVELFISKTGFSGLMSGQCMDLKYQSSWPQKTHLKLIQLKTGGLIEASVEGPSWLWAKSPKQRQALKDYAYFLGLSYQLADDIMDQESRIPKAQKLLKQFTQNSLKSLSLFKDKAEPLKQLSLKNQNRALKS